MGSARVSNCACLYLLCSGPLIVEQDAVNRHSADETFAQTKAKVRKLCRDEKKQYDAPYDAPTYEQVKLIQELVPTADPPWPRAWPTIQFVGHQGPESVVAFPQKGLQRIAMSPSPENLGESIPISLVVFYQDFAVDYSLPTVAPKKGARAALTALARDVKLAPALVQRVSDRIDEQSELEIHREGIKRATGPDPSEESSLEELVYCKVILEAYSPAIGSKCREISAKNRTVLCFSDANLSKTAISVMMVYDRGTPQYSIVMRWLWRGPDGGPLIRSRRHQDEFASILRSVLHLALRVEERK